MARERFVNQGTTTLNGGINDVTTTVVVNNGSVLPALGQYRIIVDSEIMLVTARSVNTLTVVRGQESTANVSHSSGASVAQVVTLGGIQRYMRDWNNPFFDASTPMQLLDINGNALTASSFTDVNFTNATKADQTGGSILIEHDTQSAANDFAIINKVAPTAPWTLRVGFIPNLINETGDFPSAGPCVRDNTTGEFYAFRLLISDNGTWVDVVKQNSPTVSGTAFLPFRDWSGGSGVVWFEIEDNNTNLIFKVSADGVNYITLGQEARTAFLTPDRIGFFINNFGNGLIKAHATIVAWNES